MNTLFQRKSGGQDEVEKKLLQLPEPPLVDQIVADLEDATPSDVVFNSGLFFSTFPPVTPDCSSTFMVLYCTYGILFLV